jgi:hypothetical protein
LPVPFSPLHSHPLLSPRWPPEWASWDVILTGIP